MALKLPGESRFRIYDSEHTTKLLSEQRNFRPDSTVDVCEIIGTKGAWHERVSGTTLSKTINDFHGRDSVSGGRLLIIFVSLRYDASISPYKHQVSISQKSTLDLVTKCLLHPAFVPDLLGRPDYWAPGVSHDPPTRVFYCQHPRWNINAVAAPCSVYMRSEKADKVFYVVVTGEGDSITNSMQSHMSEFLSYHIGKKSLQIPILDPFYIHIRISILIFEQSKFPISELRTRLYQQLDRLDELPAKLAGKRQLGEATRRQLAATTRDLNVISRNTDSLLASANRGIGVVKSMLSTYERDLQVKTQQSKTKINDEPGSNRAGSVDNLHYVLASLELDSSWLQSYKSRKDTAMGLVFNMVVQLDSLTNVDIGREMKKDSSSMNAIATLTMLFLPATAVATIFGSNIFLSGLNVHALIAYIAITSLLTLGSLLLWTFQPTLRSKWRFHRRNLSKLDEDDEVELEETLKVQSSEWPDNGMVPYRTLREYNSVTPGL